MDEATGETETLMNVESFSQLPFIRRPKNNNPKPIRLFGKDFSGTTTGQEDNSETKNKEAEEDKDQTRDDDGKDNNIITNNRRFECHYCFRNFPTSQALGGHQNAHKRERQLAKRGASSYFHHPDMNLHGYRHFPSWTSGTLTGASSYGGQASGPQSSAYFTRPSYGSQLGIWRLPPSSSGVQGVYNANAVFTRNDFSSSSSNSTLPSHQPQQPLPLAAAATQNRMSSSYRYGLSLNVQDHVSLDLHL